MNVTYYSQDVSDNKTQSCRIRESKITIVDLEKKIYR